MARLKAGEAGKVTECCAPDTVHGRGHGVWVEVKHRVWSVIRPESSFRINWDLLMLAVLIYVCVSAPYIVCFDIDTYRVPALLALEIATDVLWLVEIQLNFRTAYKDDLGNMVTSRRKIAWSYASSWLVVDAVSVLPLGYLLRAEPVDVVAGSRVTHVTKFLRLIKVIRLLRMLKFPQLLLRLARLRRLGRIIRPLSFFCAAFLLLHLLACVFFYVADVSDLDNSWLLARYGDGLGSTPNADVYLASLYWATSTMATVGYGDIAARNPAEQVVSIITMLVGVTVFAYFTGAVSSLVAAISAKSARRLCKLRAVAQFVRHREVPSALAARVSAFYEYVLDRETHAEEAAIIGGLSQSLKNDVVLFLYRDALEQVPFFRGKSPQFIASIVERLTCECYAPADMVVKQRAWGNRMYFVAEGTLEARLYAPVPEPLPADDPRLLEQQRLAEASGVSAPSPWTADAAGTPCLAPVSPECSDMLHKLWQQASIDSALDAGLGGARWPFRALGLLRVGQLFGETACIHHTPHDMTVVATCFCELHVLPWGALEQVLAEWPHLADEFQSLAGGNSAALGVHDECASDPGSCVPCVGMEGPVEGRAAPQWALLGAVEPAEATERPAPGSHDDALIAACLDSLPLTLQQTVLGPEAPEGEATTRASQALAQTATRVL